MVYVGNVAHFHSAFCDRRRVQGDAIHSSGAAFGTCGIWSAGSYVDKSAIVAWVEHILIFLTMTLEAIEELEYLIAKAARIGLD